MSARDRPGGADVRLGRVLLRPLAAGAVLAAGLVVPFVAPAGPAAAADLDCVGIDPDATTVAEATAASLPLDLLGIPAAHAYFRQRGLRPGEGVTVAVLDSGVTRRGGVTVAAGSTSLTGSTELQDFHGTAVAGLIAGSGRPDAETYGDRPVGVAPYAKILDVRIYDSEEPDADARGVTTEGIVAGLEYVLEHREVDIVTMALLVDTPDERIEKLVNKLRRRGVVVVAPSGNRPGDETQPLGELFAGEPKAGEDAAEHVFPAAYRHVVAVSATTEGLPGDQDAAVSVLPNSATDVAAPVAGAVSVGMDGGTCLLGDEVATSWATALVSGVLALMRSLDPDATADQLVARLEATADGRTDVRTRMTGAGVVQPLEALRRPVTPAADGTLEETPERRTQPVVAPEPEPDTLVGTRRAAVWWGVLGGGVLLLALVLRPVLARRTPPR